MKIFCAVFCALCIGGFGLGAEEAVMPSLTSPRFSSVGGTQKELMRFPVQKLSLGSPYLLPVPKQDRSKVALEGLKLNILPIPTNSVPVWQSREVRLEVPEKMPFPNFHYIHADQRNGESLDAFGRLWRLSKRTELVLPYVRWESPSRKQERIGIGILFSFSF